MKKITSFLMLMVLCCVGAFAQYENALTAVTDLSQLNDETFYTVRSARCALIYNPAQPNALNTTNATGLTVEYDPGDTNQHFYIKQNEGKYYLYSVGAEKYVKHKGAQSVFVDDIASASELSITESGNSEYPWFLKLAGNGINTQIKGSHNTGVFINDWVKIDEGNSFKIESVDLSAINYYEVKFTRLNQAIEAVNAALNVNDLKAGVNVGAYYANYKPEIVEYFLALDDSAKKVYDLVIEEESYDVLEAMYPDYHMIDTFIADYVGAKDSVIENTMPREIPDIEAGYYTISSAMNFTFEEYRYTYWTQEEADNYNKELGIEENPEHPNFVNAGDKKDSTLVVNAQARKALYEYNGATNWGDQKETADFLWKIEKGDSAKAYKIINMNQSMTFARISQSKPVYMEKNDTSEYYITWWGKDTLDNNREVDIIAIRNIVDGPKSHGHIHCLDHKYGKGENGNIVGWIGDAEASQWFLTPVDEETAQKWMDSQKPVLELRAKIKLGDSIAAAFPAQLKIAQDSITVVGQSASQFYSPYSVNDSQSIPAGKTVYDFLIDGKTGTYWHSDWYNRPSGNLVHYLQIESAEPLTSEYKVRMVRRNIGGDQITKLAVRGYDANDANLTYEQGEDLGIIELPLNTDALTEPFFSNSFKVNGSKVIRFYCAETQATTSGGQAEQGFWHAAEFNVYLSKPYTRYETTQYDVRKNEADALAAAVKKWNEGKFRDDSLALISDAPFAAAYGEIVAAGKAWGDVYVDPTELREAIANVPAENMFPIGTNPGEWASLDLVPVLKVGIDAEAYNANGAYTKEKTAEWLKAISDADATSYANANKVKTGVWYQFAFPSEAMFDKFGWDKVAGLKTVTKAENTNTGVDIVRCEGIFDKVIAAGRGITNYTFEANGKIDTVTQYTASIIDDADYYEDQNMFFFSRSEAALIKDGANLFRFIEATDSSYIIQNQATGLFLRGGHPCTLSSIPTYWSTKALGAGGNLITFTDILGNTVSKYRHLHGQKQDRKLVCWSADQLGSRSMMLIEEVETVTEEPATEYMMEVWPGKVYAMTMPVDITILNGAKAYSADLIEGDSKQDLYLSEITEMPIKAGQPFVLIADQEDEYISINEITEQITEQMKEELGVDELSIIDQHEVYKQIDNMYAIVELQHGMEINTTTSTQNDLVSTMTRETVVAGKGITAQENGFAHTTVDTWIPEFSAYIACDFDAKSPIVQTPINVIYGNYVAPDPSIPTDNTMFAEKTSVRAGEEFVLSIMMDNTEPIISYEFELCLPQGFSVKKNNTGEYAVSNACPRVSDHKFVTTLSDNGYLKVAAYSMTNKAIQGNSGAVANITLIAENTLAKGDYEISLNNIVMTKADAATNFEIEETTSIISILKEIPGDINNDGYVNITDIAQVIGVWIQGTDNGEVLAQTDLNNDGKINVTDISAIIKLYLEYSVSSMSPSLARTNVPKNRDNVMFAETININAGETQEVKINLTNPNITVISAEFDICLPNGFEIAKDENGKLEISLGSRLDEYEILTKNNADGTTKIAFYSMTNSPVIDREGNILFVKIKATEKVTKGKYELRLTNQLLTNSDIKSVYCASTASPILVGIETSIGAVDANYAKKTIYDLSGRRIKAKLHGIYIINNKKVVK